MTIAVCMKCGRTKFGAFCPCDHCGFTPRSSSERAESIFLSDHYYAAEELNRFGEAIQSGQRIAHDPDAVATYMRMLDLLESDPKAMQCSVCGEDRDSFDYNLCPSCRALKDAAR